MDCSCIFFSRGNNSCCVIVVICLLFLTCVRYMIIPNIFHSGICFLVSSKYIVILLFFIQGLFMYIFFLLCRDNSCCVILVVFWLLFFILNKLIYLFITFYLRFFSNISNLIPFVWLWLCVYYR